MEELEGETFSELLVNRLKQLREWLKPNPVDSLLVQSLKMIYKAIAVILLVAFSPVILFVLFLAFAAAF
ncbi:hypothetical protein EXU57_19150 [Segetibacter sp. 3557_3]|uniref:hypothetical protein n=1 Tax=Segetibacter sp. 3557_3 TaxID=2547429 RepID=UPI001058FF0D|nr:hypothetical protein [Segetibacter sp. 3557_3]TDH21621.1 hypothetical protein EXU57_19150 [Segetibacter sp. 3557_3]